MKKTLLLVGLSILSMLTLFAQTVKAPRVMHFTEKSSVHVPPAETPAHLKKIYSNLGKSKTDLYNDTEGFGVGGPNSQIGTQFYGMPFTPKSDSHVSQVQVAVGYFSGANQVNLSLYIDNAGTPGTLIAGPITVTNLPGLAGCCELAVANFPSTAVTAGTRYWVVADTPISGTGSDFAGAWLLVPILAPQSANYGNGWSAFNGTFNEVAGEVLGSVP